MLRDMALTTPNRNQVDSFFSEFFNPEWVSGRARFLPPVDIKEYEDKYVILADLPGVDKEDLKIEVNEGKLVLEGRRQEKHEDSQNEGKYLLSERTFSEFRRVFNLGDHVMADKIEANYDNGTLCIELPKAEKVRPKVIPIRIK